MRTDLLVLILILFPNFQERDTNVKSVPGPVDCGQMLRIWVHKQGHSDGTDGVGEQWQSLQDQVKCMLPSRGLQEEATAIPSWMTAGAGEDS